MKRDKDKELDDLFKNGLGEPPHQVAFREGDWDAMEQMLDGPKKNRVIAFWLPIASVAAVLLILIGGWWLFTPVADKNMQKPQVVSTVKTPVKDSAAQAPATVKEQPQIAASPKPEKANLGNADALHKGNGGTMVNQIAVTKNNLGNADAVHKQHSNQATNQLAATKNNLSNADAVRNKNNSQTANQLAITKNNLGNADNSAPATNSNFGNADNVNKGITNSQIIANNALGKAANIGDSAVLAANKPTNTTGSKPVNKEMDSIIKANNTEVIASVKPKVIKAAGDNHVQFGLSVFGAPEINTVGSFGDSKRGTNIGLLFSAGIKKLTLSTGATYAIKPYGSTYDASSTQYAVRGYLDGLADCRVLDIPINLDYQLINKKQNKFSVGAGVSSYIMLHESYLYNYIDPDISPSTYTVPNVHKYMFSVLNLQTTYTRQLSPKIGLSVQPYLKLPLQKIGNSQAKLQTAGVAVGLNWTINPGKKR